MEISIKLIIEIAAGLGTILAVLKQLHEIKAKWEEMIRQQAVRDERLEERMNRIEERLDEHNEYGAKFEKNSEKTAEMNVILTEIKTDLRWIKEKIS